VAGATGPCALALTHKSQPGTFQAFAMDAGCYAWPFSEGARLTGSVGGVRASSLEVVAHERALAAVGRACCRA
jgi:hypothetical protein